MKKRFNIAGVCVSHKHYMVDISNKLDQVEEMIEHREYFIINRPRQYGKTTLMFSLERRLKDKYLIIPSSFEGIGDIIFESEETFSSQILDILADSLEFIDTNASKKLREVGSHCKNLNEVSKSITKFIKLINREVILLIDEVDKSSNNQLFLSFLGILRNKYLLANMGRDYTFHSIILAGVHDVKNLKLKLRPDQEKKYNSPWNIAVNFNVDMSFSSKEIETMLKQYSKENETPMNTEELSEVLYYYTSGYPFLVSRLCQIIDENILKNKKEKWITEHIEEAVKLILKENNTLFDDLIKNIENNNSLCELIERLLLIGEEIGYVGTEPLISLGSIYGILKDYNGKCVVHNKIFEHLIYNHLTAKKTIQNTSLARYNFRNDFIKNNNELDFQKILLRYQQFMKENHSRKDEDFIEREGRLLFLAFIKPIINGVGFDFKEVQISNEKRLDIVVTYLKYKYVVELKIWNGPKYHKEGIKQLCDYLDIQGLDKGYLIIYNFNKSKEYKQEIVNVDGKEIFMVWV